MAEQVYESQDDLTDAGALADIQIDLPLMNQQAPRREKLQLLRLTLTNEPRGNGMVDAKGVFMTAVFSVMGGTNDGREFAVRVYCDDRVKQGGKQSAWKTFGGPFIMGLATAIHGAESAQQFYQGAVRSKQTQLEDLIGKAGTLAGQQFSADVGVERGGKSKTPNAQGEYTTFQDKQIIKAWHPKGQ